MTDETQPNKNGYVNRAKLQEQLDAEKARNDALEARLAALEQKAEAPVSAVAQRELESAQAELAMRRSAAPARGPMPTLIPYEGWVQATEPCHIGGAYREKDDVFLVSMPALWTDDPFMPVNRRISSETNQPVVTPNSEAPTRIDFRFRLSGRQDTDIPALRASAF